LNSHIAKVDIARLDNAHQIKQIATGWTSVGPRKTRTYWTISELNPVSSRRPPQRPPSEGVTTRMINDLPPHPTQREGGVGT